MQPRYALNSKLRERIRQNLAAFEIRSNTHPELKDAAVTLLLVSNQINETCVVLTRRPSGLRRHAGQYALPGGRLEPGENATVAALRETWEEVGVKLDNDSVLGRLDDFQTRSGYSITPIVAWGGANIKLQPDPEEVAKIFLVPLWDLARPEIPELRHSDESEQPVLAANLASVGHRIFAPTAAVLYQFREVALFGKATRVAHFEQPRFAWR